MAYAVNRARERERLGDDDHDHRRERHEQERREREGGRREGLVERQVGPSGRAEHELRAERDRRGAHVEAHAEKERVEEQACQERERREAFPDEHEDVDRERERHARDERDDHAREAEVLARKRPRELAGPHDRTDDLAVKPGELATVGGLRPPAPDMRALHRRGYLGVGGQNPPM